MDSKYNKILTWVSIIMLILAIPPMWPYFYYQILRWVVAGTAVYNAFYSYKSNYIRWVWIMIIIGIIFNPVEPIFLGKEIWIVLDIISAIIFLIFSKEKLGLRA